MMPPKESSLTDVEIEIADRIADRVVDRLTDHLADHSGDAPIASSVEPPAGFAEISSNPAAASLLQILSSGKAIAVGFIFVHLWLTLQGMSFRWGTFNYVDRYEGWARRGLEYGYWPVLDFDWVYPIGAIVPLTLPTLGNSTTDAYQVLWTVLVYGLSAVALWRLTVSSPRGWVAAWWWLAFLAALGPIWVTRLEGVIAPLMLVAWVEIRHRPELAVVLATIGAWIKIVPGVLVLAMATCVGSVRDGLRRIVLPGAVVSAVIVGLALLGGAGTRVFGVFGEQHNRSLQVESVAATAFSIARLWNPDIRFENNPAIATIEVVYPTVETVASVLDVALIVSVLALLALTFFVVRRRPELTIDALLVGSYAVMLAMVVFNKVGSPQFAAWIGPPVAAGLALAGPQVRRLWLGPAVGLLGVALLTHAIFPLDYVSFLNGHVWMITLAAARNLGYVALLGLALWRLIQMWRVGLERGDDLLGLDLGIAEEHGGIFAEEQRVLHPGVSGGQGALEDDHLGGPPHL